VVVSLTSIPTRFDKLAPILERLTQQTCHEVWLNIPRSYTRFPNWDGTVPENLHPKVRINRDCEDFGPGTKFIGPALKLDPDDIIVYLDDDTNYDPKSVTNLLKWWRTDPQSAWGLSGFNFENYFKGHYPRTHGTPVDVLEGYGAVLVKAKWVQDALPEFKELLEVTWHDDMILCNLLQKAGIKRKTVFTPECHIGHVEQQTYGFGQDALHHIAGGSHQLNNIQILKNFRDKGKLYYTYTSVMLVDTFMFYNEYDVLELRLEVLDKYVDRFVLVESEVNHVGGPKELFFQKNKERYAKWLHKIEHIVVTADESPKDENPWSREKYQRECILRGVQDVPNDAIVMISQRT
jgi:hypothetical protein